MAKTVVPLVLVVAAICLAALPRGVPGANGAFPPEKECVADHGDFCNKLFNFCNGGSGTCSQCTFNGRHAKCDGAAGPCVTHYSAAGCGVMLTATCDSFGGCTGWTSTGPDCSQLQCGPGGGS